MILGTPVYSKNRTRLGTVAAVRPGRLALLVEDGRLIWLSSGVVLAARRGRLMVGLDSHELAAFALATDTPVASTQP